MQPIWTIGHSTRKIDIFVSLLEENGINLIADVRSFPGSKRDPQSRCKQNRAASVYPCGAHRWRHAKLRERQRPVNLARLTHRIAPAPLTVISDLRHSENDAGGHRDRVDEVCKSRDVHFSVDQ